MSWDAANVYIGMQGPDIGSNDGNKWVLIYIGGDNGTTLGQTYNTQQPALPFEARYHVRWKASNDYTDMMVFNGSAWESVAFLGTPYRGDNGYLEIALPRTSIGNPTTLELHLSMINEAGGGEWSFAAVPDASFTDGYDPDYGAYYAFDLSSPNSPASYSALP